MRWSRVTMGLSTAYGLSYNLISFIQKSGTAGLGPAGGRPLVAPAAVLLTSQMVHMSLSHTTHMSRSHMTSFAHHTTSVVMIGFIVVATLPPGLTITGQ